VEHTLKSGYTILFDAVDADLFYSFSICTQKSINSYTRYVRCRDKTSRSYVGLLHRLIMKTPDDLVVDHINGNGLDNRRTNLRNVINCRNQWNRRRSVNKTKGVYFRHDRLKWVARITVKNEVIHLGYFDTETEASLARSKAEEKYYGEYAGLGTEIPGDFRL